MQFYPKMGPKSTSAGERERDRWEREKENQETGETLKRMPPN